MPNEYSVICDVCNRINNIIADGFRGKTLHEITQGRSSHKFQVTIYPLLIITEEKFAYWEIPNEGAQSENAGEIMSRYHFQGVIVTHSIAQICPSKCGIIVKRQGTFCFGGVTCWAPLAAEIRAVVGQTRINLRESA